MNKKSQVLIISLWILIILTIFTISIAHRVSMALRLSRYQKDSLKALYLAKAGINQAIVTIKNDDPNYDSLTDKWADNKEEAKFGVIDEERKININTASPELLVTLLKESDITDTEAQEIVSYIKKPFVNIEELVLILEYFYQEIEKFPQKDAQEKAQEIFAKTKDLITVYPVEGTMKANANTASEIILTIIANSVAVNQEEKKYVEAVVKDIIRQREEKEFKAINDIKIEGNLFGRLRNQLTVNSNYFKIEATGDTGKTTKKIAAIYDRTNNKVVYWHEN